MATRKARKSSSGSDPKSKRIVKKKMGETMHEMKHGELKSGRSGKKVKNPKQAIAIGLSEARRAGADIPPSPNKGKKAAKKSTTKKSSGKKSAGSKTTSKKSGSTRSAAKKRTGQKSASKKKATKRS